MCKAYTYSFTKTGLLDKSGRMPYSKLSERITDTIDMDRARNEIALVDLDAHTVTYGLDSLMKILSNRWSFYKPLFGFKPFYSAMRALYSFISYNRRVIIPAKEYNKPGACTPEFNLKYRRIYIVTLSLLTILALSAFMDVVFPGFPIVNIALSMIAVSLVLFTHSSTARYIDKSKHMEYTGNLVTIMFLQAAALALMPIFNFSEAGELAYIVVVFLAGVNEHCRRVNALGYSPKLSILYASTKIIALTAIMYLMGVL